MTTEPASRKPLPVSSDHPTLADVIAKVAADENLALRRRQDLRSAVRTLGKALGRRVEEIPAHPAYLRDRLKAFTPAMAGLSRRRWHNVLSLTRVALKNAGLAHVPGRYREPLSPEWSILYRHLNAPHVRIGLSRLARYCSTRGIVPGRVDDSVMSAFLESLLNDSLINKPREVHRIACHVWNRAAATIPSWPKLRLSVPDYRRAYTLPWSSFPASLKAGVDAYLDRLAGKDILGGHDFRPLRPASVKNREFQLRQFVSALVHRGRDPESLRSLADLVAVDTVKEGLRFFVDRAGGKTTQQIHNIACMLKAMARHAVKVDATNLEELRSICRRLDPGRNGLTERNRARLRQFDDPGNLQALLTLPQRIVAKLSRGDRPTRADALAVQSALAVELLVMVPVRISNLAGLDLERHIFRTRTRGKGIVHLAIPGNEVKNGVEIEAELPPSTVALLNLYIERYRPVLVDKPSSWLFPGRGGAPKSPHSLSSQITKCIREKCGLHVHSHLFRHFAAKVYLDRHPGAYGLIRLVNGHKSVDTTTRFYCGLETPAAMRHFDEHVLNLRESLVAPTPSKRRRESTGEKE